MRSVAGVLTLALLLVAGVARAQVTTTTSTTSTTNTGVAETTSTSTTTSSTTSTLCTPPEIDDPAICRGRATRKQCRQCCKQQVFRPARQACECRRHPNRDLDCPATCRQIHRNCVQSFEYGECVGNCEDKAPGGCNAIANCVRKCQRQREGNRFFCGDLLDDCFASCPQPDRTCVREGKEARRVCFEGCESLPKKVLSEPQVVRQAQALIDEGDCAKLLKRCETRVLSQCRLNCLDEDACFGIPEAIELCQGLCAERVALQPALGACGNRANNCCIEAGCPTTTTTTTTTTTSVSTTSTSTTTTTVVTTTTTTTL